MTGVSVSGLYENLPVDMMADVDDCADQCGEIGFWLMRSNPDTRETIGTRESAGDREVQEVF